MRVSVFLAGKIEQSIVECALKESFLSQLAMTLTPIVQIDQFKLLSEKAPVIWILNTKWVSNHVPGKIV